MDRQFLSRIPALRRLAFHLGAVGLPLLAAGCADQAQLAQLLVPQHAVVARGAAPELLPPPKAPQTEPAATVTKTPAHKVLPISLDDVIHMAATNNLQVQKQRAKVAEAEAKVDLACKKCVPLKKKAVNQVRAETDLWQQKAELSRLISETVLEASSTYIDLLTARTGKTIAEELLADLLDLRGRATRLAETEPGARVEVARIRAEIEARHANVRRFEAQAAAASAKLIYLLALDPCTELLPVDTRLVPIDVVDVTPPTCDLVAKALAQGPAIREMEELVALIDDSMNRSDLFWVLVYCRLHCEAKRIAEAQQAEAHYALDDLRAKLTAGVQEAHQAILNGFEEVRRANEQVKHSTEARKLSKQRLENNVMGSSPSEVLLSLQSLGSAHVNYLTAIRDYNKAQLRLLTLTTSPNTSGALCGPQPGPGPVPF